MLATRKITVENGLYRDEQGNSCRIVSPQYDQQLSNGEYYVLVADNVFAIDFVRV
jgi:hypothetical protein